MGEDRVCRVCNDRSDGAHFGVDSCRACAAFFRRSIVMKKKYVCRQGAHACNINKSIRCMCRACRFRKCIRAGMSREAVQNPRDHIGRRDSASTSGSFDGFETEAAYLAYYNNGIVETTPPYETEIHPSTTPLNPMPYLSQLQRGYAILREKRLQYNVDPESSPIEYKPVISLPSTSAASPCDYYPQSEYANQAAFQYPGQDDPYRPAMQLRSPPRSVSNSHTDKLLVNDYANILEFVAAYYPRLDELPNDQKRLLYRSFFSLFLFMEGACRSATAYPGRTDRLVVSDGNYIDIGNLSAFFDGDRIMSSEEAERVFRPSFDLFINSLLKPVIALGLSEIEIVALLALTVYMVGIEGESDHTNAICQEVQEQIFRELVYYYSTMAPHIKEPSVRVARLTALLPGLQRVVSRHWEDLLISKLFTDNYNDTLYKIFRSP